MRPWFAWILLAAFLPSGHASSTQPLDLVASSAEWTTGNATTGTFLLLQHDVDSGEVSFWLDAESIEVATTHSDAYLRAPNGVAYNSGATTTAAIYDQAHVSSGASRSGRFAYAVPVPGALSPSVSLACGHGEAPAFEPQVHSQLEQPNPYPMVDVSRALQVAPCGPVLICGTFTVVLWEWDGQLQTPEGTFALESGVLVQNGAADTRNFFGSAQQLALTASNGCFGMTPAEQTAAFVEGLDIRDASSLTLRRAQGTMDGLDSTVSGTLKLIGSALHATLTRASDPDRPVTLQSLDGARSAEIDGQPLVLTTVQPGQPDSLGWMLYGAVGAVLAPLAAFPVLRRRRTRRHADESCRDMTNRQRWDEAETAAENWASSEPASPELQHRQALILKGRDDFTGALRLRDQLVSHLRPEDSFLRAENDFERAILAGTLLEMSNGPMRQDLARLALRHLRSAVEARPELESEIPRHAELAGLAREVEEESSLWFMP